LQFVLSFVVITEADMSKNEIQPGKGKVLIAEPFMKDPYFKRSVVLLTDHNERGSTGFILNKAIELKLNSALADFPGYEGSLYLGGPVGTDQLYYIHTLGKKITKSIAIIDGLWWGGDFEKVKTLISNKEIESDQIRFFVGYAGWDANQLQKEMKEGSWIVTNAEINTLMDPHTKDLWPKVIKSLGGEYKMMASYPEDPQLN
jgi:putative transcriptional regulator